MLLHIGEDNRVTWSGLFNEGTGAYVNNATLVFTLKDAAGNTVAGASALPMPYVADTNGDYAGNLPETVELVADAKYTLEITATAGTAVGKRKIPCVAVDHQEGST